MKKLIALTLSVLMLAAAFAMAIPATAKALPSEYMELEYVECDGTQYIDTGIAVNSKICLEVDFQVIDPIYPGKGGSAGIVGAYVGGADKTGRFQIAYSREKDYITMGMGALLVNTPDIIPKDTNRHTASLDAYNGKLIFDGKVVGEMAPAELGFTVTEEKNVTLTIGASNISSTPSAVTKYCNGASKIYSVAIYEKDVLKANYVPAKAADGTVGMYDTVSNTFLSNSLEGGENFIAGPTVSAEPVETADTAVYYIAALALAAVLGTAFFAKRREQ